MKILFSSTNSSSQSERLGLLTKLFIAILLIVIFEGALRKWVSIDLTYPVIAFRDVLAIYGILWALIHKKQRYSPRGFQQLYLLSVLILAWGLLLLLINNTSLIIYLLGLRFWLLYLWFAFFVGISISEYDFKIISKLIVLLLIAMVPLVVIQHFLPVTSFWNKQLEEGFVFRVSRDIVRVSSTFSFAAGYSAFLTMAGPFVFLSLDPVYQLWQSKWVSILALASLLVATVVSGSRTAIIVFSLFFLVYSLSSVYFAKGRIKAQSFLIIMTVIVMLMVFLSVFSRAVDATRDRFTTASETENPIDRLIYSFAPAGEIPFLGEGIGMGSNFASVLIKGKRMFMLAESENARIILEAGLFGLGIVLLKVFIIWRAGRLTLRFAKYTGSVSTLIIWVALAIALLGWPIIGQLTNNALGYMLFGLGIAALRLERKRLFKCR